MELTFLYWNFNCRSNEKEAVAARVALHNQSDVLILDETTTDPSRVLELLNERGASYSRLDLPRGGRRTSNSLQVFSRLPPGELARTSFFSDHTHVLEITRPGCQAVLVALVHLKSRLSFVGHQDPVRSQQDHAEFENSVVTDAENDAAHLRTIVVGDFNMNPFEPGMIDPRGGFGAMICRELAIRDCPTCVKDPAPRRFYNPLWSRMGLDFPSPPGTYYHSDMDDRLNIYWHTLDQVLVRPSLLGGFRDEDLRIIDSIPGEHGKADPLIRRKKKHWGINESDHLPLLFKLELPKEECHA